MTHRSTQSREHTEADLLVERLRLRLTRLSYLAFALLTERLLMSLGYTNVRLLGRQHLRGRTRLGGADLSASGELALGTVPLLVQVKTYTRPVSRRFIDELRGVMLRRGIPEGLSITTSDFSRQAREATLGFPGRPIRLMDGEHLARTMIQAGLGVSTTTNLITGATAQVVDELAFLDLERAATSYKRSESPNR